FLRSGLGALADLFQLGSEPLAPLLQLFSRTTAGVVDSVPSILGQRAHPPPQAISGLLSPLGRKEKRNAGAHQHSQEKAGDEPGSAASLDVMDGGRRRGLNRTIFACHHGSMVVHVSR